MKKTTAAAKPAPKTLTPAEFAEKVGRSAYAVRRMIRSGAIKAEIAPNGWEWVIPASEVARFRKAA